MIDPDYIFESGRYKGIPVKRVFWSYVAKREQDQCWYWAGHMDGKREYGRFRFLSDFYCAHRIAYFFHFGIWPRENICHSCDVPSCCNPYHLFEGSHQINANDMVSKGRQTKGENHPSAKLTEADVLEIRRLALFDITQEEIASKFPVGRSVISDILNRNLWNHV